MRPPTNAAKAQLLHEALQQGTIPWS